MDILQLKKMARDNMLKYFDLLDVEEQINIAGYVEHKYKQQEKERQHKKRQSGDPKELATQSEKDGAKVCNIKDYQEKNGK